MIKQEEKYHSISHLLRKLKSVTGLRGLLDSEKCTRRNSQEERMGKNR
jgi:hypothetical protein